MFFQFKIWDSLHSKSISDSSQVKKCPKKENKISCRCTKHDATRARSTWSIQAACLTLHAQHPNSNWLKIMSTIFFQRKSMAKVTLTLQLLAYMTANKFDDATCTYCLLQQSLVGWFKTDKNYKTIKVHIFWADSGSLR